jgi:23S rRNA (cytosine1962-C5)-methyltransferase
MIDCADPKARPGDVVAVYDKSEAPYGVAFYNPKSLITLRLITRRIEGFSAEAFFAARLKAAVDFRRSVLGLDRSTNAYRLVHDQGDGFPGLAVDRYGDCLVLEFYSLGMFRLAPALEKILLAEFPGSTIIRRASGHSQTMEGFKISAGEGARARIRENGVFFEADLAAGYKTGFFCDQRDNRLFASTLASGRDVLDLCSYTGGFGLYARKLGGASEATCVELDPEASELARRNANANQVRVRTVCADAFCYLRQMAENKERFGLVVLDPYKLIASREGFKQGRQKYLDLNRLALGVLEEGGIFVTASCSGLLPMDEFQSIVRLMAGSAGRRLQIFRRSGAGPDHPFAADHPEGEYLKVLWCRALD